MIKSLFNLFFLWRSNNPKSIAFKTFFWAALAWFFVGIFTDTKTALIAGGSAAIVAFMRYFMQYRREHARMLELAGGNKEGLKALKKKVGGGMAGGLVMEMLRADMEAEDFEEDELSDEEKEKNRGISKSRIDAISSALIASPHINFDENSEYIEEVLEEFSCGDDVAEPLAILTSLLPESELSFDLEDFSDEGDHASLLELFSEATNKNWSPANCTSSFDEENKKWVVTFSENGKTKVWRFNQRGDYLSEKFLCQLINKTEESSEHKIIPIDTDEFYSAICLPKELHKQLVEEDLLESA